MATVRVSERIKESVPREVYSHFVQLLRDVKMWAHSRQIYGQRYCFLGGISWAILAGYVCQKFQHPPETMDLAQIQLHYLLCFFKLLSKWKWPNPIYLTEL